MDPRESPDAQQPVVAVIGGGPAGLMAAETLALGGARVQVFDAMPSIGRKLLMAGRGGLNLTHSESFAAFLHRYGSARRHLEPVLRAFGPVELRDWAHRLGIDTFVGSSGRVFPEGMKAAPLLRAWQRRLRSLDVAFLVRHRWQGWNAAGELCFAAPSGPFCFRPDATILALGGGSWPHLGSDGAWVHVLRQEGVDLAPLRPANCGFEVAWSAHFRTRHAGRPVKPVAIRFEDGDGVVHAQRGEFVVGTHGVEGSLIYALSAPLRDTIERAGRVTIYLDLLPDRSDAWVLGEVAHPRGARSLASHLKGRVGISGVKAGLLHECLERDALTEPARLAAAIKAMPLCLIAPRPLDEAISTAGGVSFSNLDEHLMLKALPGVFVAGEMIDWEAPTGGYLLTACFATGRSAGMGVLEWLRASAPSE